MNKLNFRSWKAADLLSIFFWLGIFALTHFFMRGADHFLQLTPEALGKYFTFRWILIAHITAGGGALVLGPLQFWKRLQQYSWKMHRIIGILYLLAILTSSMCALILAHTTAYEVNRPYAFSLQVWVSVWIISSFIAYRSALKKKFKLPLLCQIKFFEFFRDETHAGSGTAVNLRSEKANTPRVETHGV